MTVIRPNSISGITSITSHQNDVAFYKSDGTGANINNISINTAGIITANTFYGDGSNLTNLPAQATIANNADNRIITGGSGVNLNAESNVLYDGTNFGIGKSPSRTLDVQGKIRSSDSVCFGDNSSTPSEGAAIHRPAASTLAFVTNNTERARIDSNGNLKFNSGYGQVNTAYGVRAWINFKAAGGSNTVRGSGNATITDHGTGDFTMNFTTAMPDTGYTMTGNAGYNSGVVVLGLTGGGLHSSPTTSGFRFSVRANYNNSSLMDEEYIHLVVVR